MEGRQEPQRCRAGSRALQFLQEGGAPHCRERSRLHQSPLQQRCQHEQSLVLLGRLELRAVHHPCLEALRNALLDQPRRTVRNVAQPLPWSYIPLGLSYLWWILLIPSEGHHLLKVANLR